MKPLSRKESIWIPIVLIVLGTSMHFVHHLPGFNHFWGYIFPVSESVMAHMKMIFYPMLRLWRASSPIGFSCGTS